MKAIKNIEDLEQMSAQDRKTIMVIDDEANVRRVLEYRLRRLNYNPITFAQGEDAIEWLKGGGRADLIICDIRMSGISGEGVLRFVKENIPSVPIIMITAYGTIQDAVRMIKEGAYDFLEKPFDLNRLNITIQNAIKVISLTRRIDALEEELKKEVEFAPIVGESKEMQKIFKLMKKVADSSVTVLLYGESGTGKELVARSIHFNGPRAQNPFITINCAAIPGTLLESELFGHEKGAFTGATGRRIGKFEQAHRGTILLDEIASMDFNLQSKLLRVIQQKEIERIGGKGRIKIDVRIIASTNKDLQKEVKEGNFRDDLFYRLSVFPVELPPLRKRKGDVRLLANHFLRKFAKEENKVIDGIDPEVLRFFERFHWPGNVRQLENTIYQAVILSDNTSVRPGDFPLYEMMAGQFGDEGPRSEGVLKVIGDDNQAHPPRMDATQSYPGDPTLPIDEMEKRVLEQSIRLHGGDVEEAAQDLDVPVDVFRDRMERYGIQGKAGLVREKERVLWALRMDDGNKTRASNRLGISRATLYRKIKKYGLEGG